MKRIPFLLLILFFITSCTKDQTPQLKESDDYPKTLLFDHVIGKLIIEYESGKRITKDIDKDTIFSRPKVSPSGSSTINSRRSIIENIGVEEELEDDDPIDPSSLAAPLTKIICGAQISRDDDGQTIIWIEGFHAYANPPIVTYPSGSGTVTRTTEIFDVTGGAYPIPGWPITVTWRYYINYKYRYSDGRIRTRQVRSQTVKVVV